MVRQDLIDAICLTNVTDREKQIKYFKRGFLCQVEWNPPGYIWNIEKFRYYTEEDVQNIYNDVTKTPEILNIQRIIKKEKDGITCTEDESTQIKQWIKNTIILPETNDQKILEDIQFYLPCEYGEAIDEIDSQQTNK